MRTLVRIIAPWRRRFAIVVASGIGRVAAFIGVGIAGALAVAAVKTGAPFAYLLILLGLLAPVAGILHWIESWLAHDIAYRLLAEMRIDLYNKLDALAPAYLVRRRSGDLIALASQDIETIEYFFAHTVAPALVAVLVPATVLLTLAFVAWPIALALLPFVLFAGLGAGAAAGAHRPARGRGARGAGPARRLCHRDDPGPVRPRRIPGGRTAARRLHARGARPISRPGSSCCGICRRRRRSSRSRPGSAVSRSRSSGPGWSRDGSSRRRRCRC